MVLDLCDIVFLMSPISWLIISPAAVLWVKVTKHELQLGLIQLLAHSYFTPIIKALIVSLLVAGCACLCVTGARTTRPGNFLKLGHKKSCLTLTEDETELPLLKPNS